MVKFEESNRCLAAWAEGLRLHRLSRNESMALFGERIGVSEATVRAMERGQPGVAIGHWLNALVALDRLEDVAGALAPRESLIERAKRGGFMTTRLRASRR